MHRRASHFTTLRHNLKILRKNAKHDLLISYEKKQYYLRYILPQTGAYRSAYNLLDLSHYVVQPGAYVR